MLNDKLTALCKGNNFAALTTLFPDGRPQTQLMWVDCDADHVIVNTERHRKKFQNIEGDPRVSIAIWDIANPYSYLEVRGTVVRTEGGDTAWAHINELSNQYLGHGYSLDLVSERMIVWIKPERIAGYG
jgi:PPOX class probable F420-dependent enzyme